MNQEWVYFSKQIKAFVHSRVKKHADAEDITQNILLKIHQNINTLNDKAKLESWIYSIARNSINSHFRKNISDPIAYPSEQPVENIAMIENDKLAIFELACCLKPLIDKLNEDARAAINAVSFEGLSQVDYAKKLNIPLPTAKSRIRRARKQLATALNNCCK